MKEEDLFSVDMESKSVIEDDIDTQYAPLELLNMYSIHGGTAMNRNDIKCIIHCHPMSINTLVGLKEPYNKVLNVHQNSVRFNSIVKIAYDDVHGSLELDEYEKFSNLIGKDNDIIFLSNHGVVVTADCAEVAWDRL